MAFFSTPLVLAFLFISTTTPSTLNVPTTVSTPLTIYQIASSTVLKYGLNGDHFSKVINCESRWDADAIGDGGHSFGIVQIYLPAHPNITKEEALDPAFAIDWMGQQWANGREKIWSCYRLFY